MTYLQPHRRPRERIIRIVAITGGAVILACAIILVFAPHVFSGLFTSLVRPFWRMEFSIASGSLRSTDQLLSENEMLRNQLAALDIAIKSTSSIISENNELKTLLGRGQDATSDIFFPLATSSASNAQESAVKSRKGSPRADTDRYTLAAVLKRPPLSAYDEAIIDIGRDHAVSTTSLVYAAGNILIGRVVDVLADTSKVRFFSSSGERYEVLIGPGHVPATALGRGGGQYEAQISREENITEGDAVLNPSLNDRPFGIVTAVLSDPAQPFKTVLFAPEANIYQLRWVLVSNK